MSTPSLTDAPPTAIRVVTTAVVQITLDDLRTWMVEGILHLARENSASIPVLVPGPENPVPAHNGSARVLAELPGKYASRLTDGGILALIDEVECLSLETAALTHEWRVRLTNLQVRWLPFSYKAEWFAPSPPVPPESPPAGTAPHPNDAQEASADPSLDAGPGVAKPKRARGTAAKPASKRTPRTKASDSSAAATQPKPRPSRAGKAKDARQQAAKPQQLPLETSETGVAQVNELEPGA